MNRYFTNSELGTMRRCPRRWYLSSYRKLVRPREIINEAAYTGTLIHEAVAEYYNRATDPFDIIEYMTATEIAAQETALIDAVDQSADIIHQNIDRIYSSKEMATLVVEGYIQWLAEEGADSYLQFVSAEEEMSVLFPSKQVQDASPRDVYLLGKLDARFVDERTGARVFMDHKSVQNFSDREKWAHLDPQFLFYALIEYLDIVKRSESDVDTDTDTWTDGGIVNMLRKSKRTARAKPPFYKRKEVRHSIHELRNFYVRTSGELLRILQATQALDSGVDHHLVVPPSPTRDCSWDCPFVQLCPMMDDGSDVDGYIDTVFIVGDPLARYDTVDGS